MNNNWLQASNSFYLREVSQQVKKLPTAVYIVNYDPRNNELFLVKDLEKFEFPYKVYGVESKFISRVTKTFKNTTGNLGVLLNGVKGTGKTVTAQMICNELNLPVVIITHKYDNISEFINSIQQDCIIFFDEYEKMYNNYDADILSVMDGVLNNEYRKVFLLTTNQSYVNANLLQRPGRIRYLKTFDDLSLEIIMEIVDDKLVHTVVREETIKFISGLETITIDIVKAIIDEVNIHQESPELFKDVFNIKAIDNMFDIYVIDEHGQPKIEYKDVSVAPNKITKNMVGRSFTINDGYIGEIKTVNGEDRIIVELDEYDDDDKPVVKNFQLTKAGSTHRSFSSYVF